jgi:APA family basic amino acid/polyamine antiporter
LLGAFGIESQQWLVAVALGAVIVLTLVVLSGIRRSNVTNIVIVSITLASLLFFILAGLPVVVDAGWSNYIPFFWPAEGTEEGFSGYLQALLHASALMFVAYTGYGRIATLGEEVRDPRHTIPRAIIFTMILTLLLYTSVAVVGIGAVGAEGLSAATRALVAPLEVAARSFPVPFSAQILGIGAITAMLGVLLNLLLGLSRVLLAMGRRGDMPPAVARLNQAGTTPTVAVVVVGVTIALLALTGNVKTTWSFSAFTVLIYYALTNLAALRLAPGERLYPRWIAWMGLGACLFLAFWVPWEIWAVGLALLVVGLLWHLVAQRLFARRTPA